MKTPSIREKKRFNRGGVILYVKAQYIKIKELIFARVELKEENAIFLATTERKIN